MNINSENIKSKEFGTEKNGFSKSEVKIYLENVANEFEIKIAEIVQLENEIDELKTNLNEFKELEKKLRDSIINLNSSEKEAVKRANEKANIIIKEAEEKSKKIIDLAEDEAKSTRDTLLFLKEQREILLVRLKVIIDNQDGLLNDLRKGKDSEELQKTIAEAAIFKTRSEFKIDSILEKLL